MEDDEHDFHLAFQLYHNIENSIPKIYESEHLNILENYNL